MGDTTELTPPQPEGRDPPAPLKTTNGTQDNHLSPFLHQFWLLFSPGISQSHGGYSSGQIIPLKVTAVETLPLGPEKSVKK